MTSDVLPTFFLFFVFFVLSIPSYLQNNVVNEPQITRFLKKEENLKFTNARYNCMPDILTDRGKLRRK